MSDKGVLCMKILVADTSSSVCAVALFENEILISENMLDNGRTHSENFMPLVEKTLKDAKLELKDIDIIGVVVGPGSFTGIRIGIASCKAMAEVMNIKMVSVTSLESLACNEIGEASVICSMIDARNNQVYCGIFDSNYELQEPYLANDIQFVTNTLKKYSPICLIGDGAIKHKNLLSSFGAEIIALQELHAYHLGLCGFKKWTCGMAETADNLLPMYLRKSQAERMRDLHGSTN